jgi:hypothetical protein
MLDKGIPKNLFEYCWPLFKNKTQLKLNTSELSRPLDLLKSLKQNEHFTKLEENKYSTDMISKVLRKLPLTEAYLARELKDARNDARKDAVNTSSDEFPVNLDKIERRIAEIQTEIKEIDALLSDTIQIVIARH